MAEPEYQKGIDLAINLSDSMRPLTAEYFVDWLIEYKGLPAKARENVISNLKRDYERVELQGALKQAMTHPSGIRSLLALREGRPLMVRHILIKVFQPGNKLSRTLRLQAPPRKGFTEQGIQSALKQVADSIERLHPLEEYELKELKGHQFNFVWKSTKEAEAI